MIDIPKEDTDGFMFYDGVGGMDDLRSQFESEESMTMGGM